MTRQNDRGYRMKNWVRGIYWRQRMQNEKLDKRDVDRRCVTKVRNIVIFISKNIYLEIKKMQQRKRMNRTIEEKTATEKCRVSYTKTGRENSKQTEKRRRKTKKERKKKNRETGRQIGNERKRKSIILYKTDVAAQIKSRET